MINYIKEYLLNYIKLKGPLDLLYSMLCSTIFTSCYIAFMIFIWKLIFKQIFNY
jgi:hypothetical protein